MHYLLISVLALWPFIALAETPLTAAEFDRYTRGKTLFFSVDGERYGAEEYFDQRRVRWTFLDGHCKDGRWFAQGPDICFVYEDNPNTQCWQFFLEPHGLSARFMGRDDDTVIYEITDPDEEMICLGPEVGV